MRYENAIVIGNGTLAFKCCKHMFDKMKMVRLYDTNEQESLLLKRKAEGKGIDYRHLKKKETFEDIAQYRAGLDAEEGMLLVSAVNPWIIPSRLFASPNVFAINLHHSYLPVHPGRNAEAWAIFEGDEYAGVTWHVLGNRVDAGAVICQKKIPLTDEMTSFQLLAKQNQEAEQLFLGFYEKMIAGENIETMEQKQDDIPKLHYSYEIPNDGLLDLEWTGKKISAFLRCMDYSNLKVLGEPYVCYENHKYTWEGYKIEKSNTEESKIWHQDECLMIRRDGYEITLVKISAVRE